MRLFRTGVNPHSYKAQIGELREIYTTTISYPATLLLIFSVAAILFGFWISFYIRMALALVPAYILFNPHFTYISIHENGVVFKKRFSHKVISYDQIEDVELRNMSLFWNKFRPNNKKLFGLDVYLKDNDRYSYGERERIVAALRYPRLDSLTRINNVKEVKDELSKHIKTPHSCQDSEV